jgi:regulator of protease activity HflC (stomatin/prohibitin superfamily)
LITKRSEVSTSIVSEINKKIWDKWIIIQDINITEFKFSSAFNQAIEAKVQAEQEALTAKNQLEKVKFEAEQQIEKSKAEAEKIRIQAEAITKQWWAEYVQLQWIQAWDWKLPTYMLGSDTNLYMPIK